jgi:uncharacterized Zn finger protein
LEERFFMEDIRVMLKGLSHDDLRDWAGNKIYCRGQGYVSLVSQLSRTEDGTLVAWVSGTDEYATTVSHKGEGGFDHHCTCPYDGWGPCKHVVAVLLAAADQLKKKMEIPLLDPDDDLSMQAFDDLEEEDYRVDEADDTEEAASPKMPPKGRSPEIESMLSEKSRSELQALLLDLAFDFPHVARRLLDAARLETGQVEKLIRTLRKEIRKLTSEDAWYNHWNNVGNLPDYSHVREQLQALLDSGHADAVLDLGEELFKRGIEQVGQSHDEGETAEAIAACLEIVLEALPLTRLTPHEQLLWIVDHELKDEYDLLGDTGVVLNHSRYTAAHWREVAATLDARLRQMGVPESGRFSETTPRVRVMTQLRNAYERSGQKESIIPLLEHEADRCKSYDTLVQALLEVGERDRARQWCLRGFAKTIADAPGIAAGLHGRLRHMAEEEGQFDMAAAYLADDFFEQPKEKTFIDLCRAAKKASVWPAVRDGVMYYLQTGKRPAPDDKGKSPWPLPKPEVRKSTSRARSGLSDFPNREMLIEIALFEERHDDAVALFRDLTKTRHPAWGISWNTAWSIDERLAHAVTQSHPEVSLQIWQSKAERLIGQVKPKAYQEAAGYLRLMRKIYETTGRLPDWSALLKRLRVQHKAKRRLMEVLDGLEKNRKLVE